MKPKHLSVLVASVCIGCHSTPWSKDQWTLQSYDKDKGYVFVRNGVQYEATCFAVGRPVLGVSPNDPPDPDPDALPPQPTTQESECSDILIYLHKPIPNFRMVYGSLLLFTEKDKNNWKLEFEIKHAF